jgi:hypothetical protein
MGFFSKVFKGIKKGFKKIGKGIKKGFAKFGKFMGKIGILGQLAMMFILPVVGGAFMAQLGSIGQSLMTTMAGSGNIILQGAAKVMQGAANFVSKAGNVFRNVTEGVTNFVGEFSKTAANKLSSSFGFQKVPFADASSTFFTGGDSAWAKSTGKFTTRMTNLTASKDTIKALDAAAQMQRTATVSTVSGTAMSSPQGPNLAEGLEGLDLSNIDVSTTTDTLASRTTDSLLQSPQGPNLAEGLEGLDLSNIDLSETTDQNWFDKGKDLLSEGWDNTKAAARDEVANFGSNTIKRIADAPVAGIEMGIKSGISSRIAGELNPQEEQYASSGAAQLQQVDVGGGQILQMPEANYGVNMSGSFGNAAVVDGYYSHMNSLSNVNNVGR